MNAEVKYAKIAFLIGAMHYTVHCMYIVVVS